MQTSNDASSPSVLAAKSGPGAIGQAAAGQELSRDSAAKREQAFAFRHIASGSESDESVAHDNAQISKTSPTRPAAVLRTVLDDSPASVARSPQPAALPAARASPSASSVSSSSASSSPSPPRAESSAPPSGAAVDQDSSDGSDDDVLPAARVALQRSQSLHHHSGAQSAPPSPNGSTQGAEHDSKKESAAAAKAQAEHDAELALADEYAEALAVPEVAKDEAAEMLARLKARRAVPRGEGMRSHLEARRAARLGVTAVQQRPVQLPSRPAVPTHKPQTSLVDLSDSDEEAAPPATPAAIAAPSSAAAAAASQGDSMAVHMGTQAVATLPRSSPKSDETVTPASAASPDAAAPDVLTGGETSQAMDTASMLSLGAAFSRVDPVLAALLAANSASLKDFDAASAERVLGGDLKALLSGNAPGAGAGLTSTDTDGSTAVKLSALPGAGAAHGRLGSMLQKRYSGVVMSKSRVGGTVGLSGAAGRAQLRASLKHTRQLQDAHAQARASGYKNALAASIARKREAERAAKRMLALREAKAAALAAGAQGGTASADSPTAGDTSAAGNAPEQTQTQLSDVHTSDDEGSSAAAGSDSGSDSDSDQHSSEHDSPQKASHGNDALAPRPPKGASAGQGTAVRDEELFGDSESDGEPAAAPVAAGAMSASKLLPSQAAPQESSSLSPALRPAASGSAPAAIGAGSATAQAHTDRQHASAAPDIQDDQPAVQQPAQSPSAQQQQHAQAGADVEAASGATSEDEDVAAVPVRRKARTFKQQVEDEIKADLAAAARRKAAAAAGETNLLADEASEGEEEEGIGGALDVGVFGQGAKRSGGASDDEEAADLAGLDLEEELKHVVDELDAEEEDKNVVDAAFLRKQRRTEDDDILRRLADGVEHGMLESRARGAAGARVQGAMDAEDAEVAALGDDEEALEAYYAKQLAMGRRSGAERVTAEDADLAASDAEFDEAGEWVGGGASDLDDTDSDSDAGYNVEKALERALGKRAAAERRLVARAKEAAAAAQQAADAAAQAAAAEGTAQAGEGGSFSGSRSELKLKRGDKRGAASVGLTRSGKRRRGMLLRTEGAALVDEETMLLPTLAPQPVADTERDESPHEDDEGQSANSNPAPKSEAPAPTLVRHGSHVDAMLALDDETRTVADGLISVSAASIQQVAQEASQHPPTSSAGMSTAASTGLSLTAALRAVVSGGASQVPSAATAAAAAAAGTSVGTATGAAQTSTESRPAPLVRSSSLAGIDLSSLMGGSNSRFGAATAATPSLVRSSSLGGGLSLMGSESMSRAAASMTFGFGFGSGASRQAPVDGIGEDSNAGGAKRSSAAVAESTAAAAAGRVKSGNTRAFVFTSAKQRASTSATADKAAAVSASSQKRQRAPPRAGGSQLGSLFSQKKARK